MATVDNHLRLQDTNAQWACLTFSLYRKIGVTVCFICWNLVHLKRNWLRTNIAKMETVANVVCALWHTGTKLKDYSTKISSWTIASWLILHLEILSNNTKGLTWAFLDLFNPCTGQKCKNDISHCIHPHLASLKTKSNIKKHSRQSLRIVAEYFQVRNQLEN